ncbi:MAG: Clp protease ClpP [Oscillospiraceae bacterium]|nr:Clp protease ClpP [Oscillospiraceae bacterium]
MRTQMNGYIVADDDAWIYRFFGYKVCSPQDIRQALEDNPPGETLTLEINSPGGSMFAGFEIYSVLQGAQCPTEAEVQSLSASASSTAMLGCRLVKASPVAQVMIHNPSIQSDGNQYVHQKTSEDLRKFAQSILNAYEIKCRGKRSREELASMMDKETWMPVQEAVENGLVDEIIGGMDLLIPSHVLNAVGSGIRAMSGVGGLPSAAELRAKKASMESGADPVDDTPEYPRIQERLAASLSLKKYY